jgi:Fe2+ or Zn2+ uptake regulation protein
MESTLAAALRERGQRVTPQRLVVARVIDELRRHTPAVVSERMPGVSLPTVYATLELLEDLGLVTRVASQPGPVVYDSRTDEHHHLVCRRCGAIADVDADVPTARLLAAARTSGFAPDTAQVVVKGVCSDCAAAAAA